MGVFQLSVNLASPKDRDFLPLMQTDTAAEKWHEFTPEAQSEIIYICSFQEELALFRIKNREPGKVGLP